eukprot:1100256-Ditylum_brightwellii.AAC.1
MALVERKEIVLKQEDINKRISLSVSEETTFESLRKALHISNSNGLDGRDVSGYREACDETQELKVHARSELKAVIKVKNMGCVDACFHENVLSQDYFFKLYVEVLPKEDELDKDRDDDIVVPDYLFRIGEIVLCKHEERNTLAWSAFMKEA